MTVVFVRGTLKKGVTIFYILKLNKLGKLYGIYKPPKEYICRKYEGVMSLVGGVNSILCKSMNQRLCTSYLINRPIFLYLQHFRKKDI